MIDEILVEEIKAKIEELTPTDEGIYWTPVILERFNYLLERLILANTINFETTCQEEYVKCPICGCIHKYGDSFCSYYATNGPFGLPVCKECYEIEISLRKTVETLIGSENKGLVNNLISKLIDENNITNKWERKKTKI